MAPAGDETSFKVPLEETPSLLIGNLSSAACSSSGEGESSSGQDVILVYSTGSSFHWLTTPAKHLAQGPLGASVKENRFECLKPGQAGRAGAGAELPPGAHSDGVEGSNVFVYEENVDKTWARDKVVTDASAVGGGGPFSAAAVGNGPNRLLHAALVRLSSRDLAVVACVTSGDLFEVEVYALERARGNKCKLQFTFSPGTGDPTEEWKALNGANEYPAPCATRAAAMVYCDGSGSGSGAAIDSLKPHLCVGTTSGDIFVFEVEPQLATGGEPNFSHIATLCLAPHQDGKSLRSPVACLCSVEEAHLEAAAAAMAPAASLRWNNLLFVGHDDGTIVMWALTQSDAKMLWKSHVSNYLESFDAGEDALVAMRLLPSTNQLLVATLNGTLVVVNFEALAPEKEASLRDSAHFVRMNAGATCCVASVFLSRIHAGWVSGIDVIPLAGGDGGHGGARHLLATCSQDGSVQVFALASEEEKGSGVLKCLLSHSSQFCQFTGVSFIHSGADGAKLAATAYEKEDATVFHINL